VLWDVREIGERVGIRLDIANKLCHSVLNPTDEIAKTHLGFRSHSPALFTFKQGETDMGDKGKKDKGKKEQQKKAVLNPKEKRKLRKEKKNQ